MERAGEDQEEGEIRTGRAGRRDHPAALQHLSEWDIKTHSCKKLELIRSVFLVFSTGICYNDIVF